MLETATSLGELLPVRGEMLTYVLETGAVRQFEALAGAATQDAAEFAGRTQALIGESAAIRAVWRRLDKLAASRVAVLITGETGTGKEVVARLLHERAPWATAPFIPVNCGALGDALIESELFGHVKGAFSGATEDHAGLFVAAGDGTILLDEIHTLAPALQAKLLRVLEDGEVRPVGGTAVRHVKARVIATTNESLEDAMRRQAFRPDLYYRLARLRIDLPPLRERKEDIPALARCFLAAGGASPDTVLAPDLLEALAAHDWPGNVRELRNAVERIALDAGALRVWTAELFQPPAAPPGGMPGTGVAQGLPDVRAARRNQPRAVDPRQDLCALFRQHGRLTRKIAADSLGCAPVTAARHLAALEREGLIRRIDPTASPRTSYFELA